MYRLYDNQSLTPFIKSAKVYGVHEGIGIKMSVLV